MATSFKDFWGRRWNAAFSELGTLVVYRPVQTKFGRDVGIWAVFIFSGFIHELSCSFPVMQGFGKPTLYFLFQALLFNIVERKWNVIFKNGRLEFIWLVGCILGPLFILLPQPFMDKIVVKIVENLTAFFV
jgi:hypothetical protein